MGCVLTEYERFDMYWEDLFTNYFIGYFITYCQKVKADNNVEWLADKLACLFLKYLMSHLTN